MAIPHLGTPPLNALLSQTLINYGTSRLRAIINAHHKAVELRPGLKGGIMDERNTKDANTYYWWAYETADEVVSFT